jgi:hypothetical protein
MCPFKCPRWFCLEKYTTTPSEIVIVEPVVGAWVVGMQTRGCEACLILVPLGV